MQEERDDFLKFIKLNTTLWSIEDTTQIAESTKIVLVDLLHSDHIYTARAILIAKVLQKKFGYRLVGLTGKLVLLHALEVDYRKDDVIRLARSFGITEFIDLEESQSQDVAADDGQLSPADIKITIDALRACPDEQLPDQVLALRTKENCRIGEYIYEGTIRTSRSPILANARSHLEAIAHEAYQVRDIIRKVCRERCVETFVTGHLSYTPWGVISDLVLRHGSKVIWFDLPGNFSAFVLTRPPSDNQTLRSMLRPINKEIFEREFTSKKWPSPGFFKKIERLYADDFMRPEWAVKMKSLPSEFVASLRKVALQKLGWADDRRPVVCVFCHCFSDEPRSDEQIYIDYYEWIVETLKIAASDKSKLWLFKSHPLNRKVYDVTDTAERLRNTYKNHNNIFFLEEELHRTEVFAVCDLAVTVRGSIAHEMSIFGRPVLLAGRSINSDLGFCYVANNEEEYRSLLTTRFHSLKFTPEMRQRAKFYLIYDKIICRVESTMIPYWTRQRLGRDSHWTVLSERILHNISDLDPATEAILRMYEEGPPRITNPRYCEIVQTAPPAADTDDHDEMFRSTAVRIQAGQALSFALAGNGSAALLSNPERLDGYGSWFPSNVSACIGFLLEEQPREQLHLALQIFVGRTASVLSISINGKTQTICCGSGTKIHLISLDQNALPSEGPFVVDISAKDPRGRSVSFRLDELQVSPLPEIRRYPAHQHLFGYPTERDGEKEFAWMPRQVLLTLPPQAAGKQLNVKGHLPFSLHQARTKISELILDVSVDERPATQVRAQSDQTFEILIPLEYSRQSPDGAINVTLSASNTLPEDADPRELSFIVSDISVVD